jgi:hypothetical protein
MSIHPFVKDDLPLHHIDVANHKRSAQVQLALGGSVVG